MGKIVFIDPVGHSGFDRQIKKYLEKNKRSDTEIEVTSLKRGPHHLEYHYYGALIGADLLHLIKKYENRGFDAVVIGCFYDPFLLEAREITEKMVITAPAESAMSLALSLGTKFSIIVGRDKWIPVMEENVEKYGFRKRLASFRSVGLGVLEFHEDEEKTRQRLIREAKYAVEKDRAEVIILGCTIQYGFYRELQEEIGVPVIDAVLAPFKRAEFMVELKNKFNWTHSKNITYETPPYPEIKEWSLEEQYRESSIDW